MIPVTKTFLPPQSEYNAILKRAWDVRWMTNRGALVKELEEKLRRHLKVPGLIAMTNGTLPIQIALKALSISGEVITTPFSYVATTSSIVWENCTPVFVDIDPTYWTIDVAKIEAAITPKTAAILATHVFGNPCDVEAIDAIAKKHGLKVIYDAAHCFGISYKGNSLFNYGDISTCSFHATKVFHTGEGGAIFTQKKELLDTLFYYHNFGHKGPEDFYAVGTNGKMSELQAAMGLSMLPYMQTVIESRRKIVALYSALLKDVSVQTITVRKDTEWNYSYFPVLFESEDILLKVKELLNSKDIHPRRYFYPSLNTLQYTNNTTCEVSESVASRIMCLPLYHDLSLTKIEEIVHTLKTGL